MSGPISSPNPLGSSVASDLNRFSISSASSSSPLVADLSSSVSADPKEIRATIIKVIKENPNKTFNETADVVWEKLAELKPEIKENIGKFKEDYKDKLTDIKDSSWKEKIKEFGDGMKTAKDEQGHTWETFRDDAIRFQTKLVGMAADVLGIPRPGWKEEGTKGYASDVDNVMVPEKGTNELDQMLIKIMADTLWVSVFGNLSGKQVELESYLPQPGLSRNTEKRVDESYAGSFLRLEITMGLLEYYRPFKDSASPNEASVYDEFVKKLMMEMMWDGQNSNSTIESAFNQIISDVANFQTEIEIGIRRQVLFQRLKKDNPQLEDSLLENKIHEILEMSLDKLKEEQYTKDELQLAHAQYTAPRLLEISQKMDENDRQISFIENRIRETQKFQWLQKKINASSIKKLIQDRSKLEIENASLGAIRNALFSETYTTQSAMITVGPAESGQMQKKFVDNLLTSFAAQLTTSRPAPLIQSPKFQSFSYLNLCMSALENLGKMRAKLENHGFLDDSALVDASKYLERICFFCHKAVEWVDSDGSGVLKASSEGSSEEYLNVASELEKCKRKQKLNPTAAREMLKQHLISSTTQFPALKLTDEELRNEITLESKIDLLLKNFFLNIERYEGEELLKNELFDQLVIRFYADVLYAGQFNSITEGEKSYLTTTNKATEPDKQIDLILMALCGYPAIYSDTLSPQESLLVDHLKALKLIKDREDGGFEVPLLKDLYEKQKELTLEKFGLKDEGNIKKLIENVEQHVINVIVRGIKLKKFPPPEADQNKFVSLLLLFKQADAIVKES